MSAHLESPASCPRLGSPASCRTLGSPASCRRVSIIGCGPGPVDLLTVRAVRAIASADLVLHDQLVGADVLALVRPGARCLGVGKRAGQGGTDVAYIARLMAREAAAGASVARLHGGDPAIFGRLAGELELLRAEGIAFEIVPGVTAALSAAAALGVPLTERGVAASVVLAAGSNPGAVADAARNGAGATLAFYMARERAPAIARELIEAGMSPGTPAALVASIGAADQRSHTATLGELQARSAFGETGPAILLVGEVLGRRMEATEAWHGQAPSRSERRGLPDDLGADAQRAGELAAGAGARGGRR